MSIGNKIEEYRETFEFLDGIQKIEYLVDLAKKSVGLPSELKNDKTRVYGCASETWVLVSDSPEGVAVESDSEAQIVKGMLYLLQDVFNGHNKEEILAVDEQGLLNQLGLGGSITNRRMNGFASAILKIKEDLSKN